MAAEHEAVRERAGVIDRSERGKIEVTGKDRATFLHGLVSNDVKGLAAGTGLRDGPPRRPREGDRAPRDPLPGRPPRPRDGPPPGRAAPGRDRPLSLLGAGRARGRDARRGVFSPSRARSRGRPWSSQSARPVPDLGRWQHVVVPWEGDGDPRRPHGGDGRGRLRPLGADGPARPTLGSAPGVGRPAGRDATRGTCSAWRLASSATASTWTRRTLLLEAPLPDSYSLNKGCYLGQEVIARITYRGHVNRKIVGFRLRRCADAARRRAGPGRGQGGRPDHERRPVTGPRHRAGPRVSCGGSTTSPGRGSRCRTGRCVALGRGRGAAVLPADPAA